MVAALPPTCLHGAIRDHLLRTAAERFCAGMKRRPAAAFLRTKLIRYRKGAWRRETAMDACPARHRGTIVELMWTLLKIRDAIPGDRTVQGALALDPFSVAHEL